MPEKLTIAEQAEARRQEGLDMLAVGKSYQDAERLAFKGEVVYVSKNVNTTNFKGVEFTHNNVNFSKATVSARLFHTVKRPGLPVIRVYSANLYGFSLNHVVNLINEISPKKIMGKVGHVLRSQESTRHILKG